MWRNKQNCLKTKAVLQKACLACQVQIYDWWKGCLKNNFFPPKNVFHFFFFYPGNSQHICLYKVQFHF